MAVRVRPSIVPSARRGGLSAEDRRRTRSGEQLGVIRLLGPSSSVCGCPCARRPRREPGPLPGPQASDLDLRSRLRETVWRSGRHALARTVEQPTEVLRPEAQRVSRLLQAEAPGQVEQEMVALAPQLIPLAHEGYVPGDIRRLVVSRQR
jgi:hypothetical protein